MIKKLVIPAVLFACFGFTSSAANIDFNPDPSPSAASPKPTLVFPVAGLKAKIGSFWGAIRDGGKRKHEGIDIFAAKHTPVVAVTNGIVTSVANRGIGGKTIWLKSTTNQYTYYYAHLDQQLVKTGQLVKKGQVIGKVGNTGNAKYTPPHLHFGVYNWKGPVDPLPHVKRSPKVSLNALKANSKKTSTSKTPTGKLVKTKAPADQSHYWKKLTLSSDPGGKYYITKQHQVIRVQNQKTSVIGSVKKRKNSKYPYQVNLGKRGQMNIDTKGRVVTSAGKSAGTITSVVATR